MLLQMVLHIIPVLENMAVGNETKEIEFEHFALTMLQPLLKNSNTLKSDLMANYKTIKLSLQNWMIILKKER